MHQKAPFFFIQKLYTERSFVQTSMTFCGNQSRLQYNTTHCANARYHPSQLVRWGRFLAGSGRSQSQPTKVPTTANIRFYITNFFSAYFLSLTTAFRHAVLVFCDVTSFHSVCSSCDRTTLHHPAVSTLHRFLIIFQLFDVPPFCSLPSQLPESLNDLDCFILIDSSGISSILPFPFPLFSSIFNLCSNLSFFF